MVSDNWFTRLLELIQLYIKTKPIIEHLIFTIYQNYTLALIVLGLMNMVPEIFQHLTAFIALLHTQVLHILQCIIQFSMCSISKYAYNF